MLVLGIARGGVVVIRHGGEELKLRVLEDRRRSSQIRVGFDGPVRFEVTRQKPQKETFDGRRTCDSETV